MTPSAKREAATRLVTDHKLSVVRACGIVRFSRAAYYRLPQPAMEKDAEVIAALNAVVERHPRNGFWKCYDRLRSQGRPWNHKRLHRVYCAMGLNLPRRPKRRVPKRIRQPLDAPAVLNEVWAMDFMADSLYGGRKIRILNVIDEGNREALATLPATSIPSTRVIRLLEELIAFYGKPRALRVDNVLTALSRLESANRTLSTPVTGLVMHRTQVVSTVAGNGC